MKKLTITVLLIFSLLPFSKPAVANDDIFLIINNFPYQFSEGEARPELINDRVYVPLRLVANALNCQVNWYEAVQTIVINDESYQGTPLLDNKENRLLILINGEELPLNEEMGQPFINEEGFTMVPLRAVGEGLDCEVTWQDNIVIISKKEAVNIPENNKSEEEEENAVIANMQTIMGESTLSAEQMNAFLDYMRPFLIEKAIANGTTFHEYPENIAELYITLGEKYGIRGDVAFAQALKETGYFQYGGIVEPWQNNFCGLGATGVAFTAEDELTGVDTNKVFAIEGTHGLTFVSVAVGVEAHLQHLYSYATDEDLPDGVEKVDPRFNHYSRGVAKYWSDLNGRWAVPGDGYGESIINDYWQKMADYGN